MHVSRRLACIQKAAASAQASDITPRLRRRALTSMFISLETRHLVWDSNNLFFIFIFQFLVGPVFFSTKQSQEKLTPNFAYIVLTNAVGLVVVAQHAPCAAHFFEVKQGNKLRPEVWSPETKELLARCCSQCIVISISGFELLRDLHVKHET